MTISQPIHRRSLVTSVTEKKGKTGDLVFVEITHELFTKEQPVMKEIQNLVYRDEGGAPPTVTGSQISDESELSNSGEWDWKHEIETDPTLLFRFSALTYNAHRIHYDRAYATEVEGYPGLVVQGPLQAVALANLCHCRLGNRQLKTFEFRARRPAFEGSLLQLRGRVASDDGIQLAVFDGDGQLTMDATAT
jgi:3-methylfumaryl-CoA hydratase